MSASLSCIGNTHGIVDGVQWNTSWIFTGSNGAIAGLPMCHGEEFTRCPDSCSQDCMRCCCGPAISGGAHEEHPSDVIEDVVEDVIEDVMEDAPTRYFNDGHLCGKNCRCETGWAYAKKKIETIDRILASAQKMHRRHRVCHATIMTRRLAGVCSCGSPESECNWTLCSHRWIASLGTQPERKVWGQRSTRSPSQDVAETLFGALP